MILKSHKHGCGLSLYSFGQCDQFFLALFLLFLPCLRKGPSRPTNLQDSIFGGSGVIDNAKFRLVATLGDALQIAVHDSQRISQQRTISWMVNVGFDGGGVGAQLLSGNDGRLFSLLHDALMDLLSAFLAKERKGPTQIAKIWNRVFIKTGEAPIEKAGSQLAVKFAIAHV